MLSAHQIFRDSKENTSVSSVKDLKLSTGTKPKGLGLKNCTNINYENKSSSVSSDECTKVFSKPVKNLKQDEIKLKNSLKDSNKPESIGEWPEIENMFIYNEPEDDYEDILPKCERFTKKDIDCFFRTSYIGRLVELTAEELPTITLDKTDLTDVFHITPINEDLYDYTPLEEIPEVELFAI